MIVTEIIGTTVTETVDTTATGTADTIVIGTADTTTTEEPVKIESMMTMADTKRYSSVLSALRF